MVDNIKGIHLDLTNMCTLKCPRCARTKLIEQFGNFKSNINLDLAHLKSFLDIDLTDKRIYLCGNYGDPIYYPDLFPLIRWVKEAGAYVDMHTNGSYRSQEWWDELVSILDDRDSIVFSIDGIPENFTQYRINADWDSILLGINTVNKTSIKMIWKYIPFSFNVDTIDQAQELSEKLGFTKFSLNPSERWDSDSDYLKPTTMVHPEYTAIVKWRENKKIEIDPKCTKTHDEYYISSDGIFMPCCYAADHRFFYKSRFHKMRDQYTISNTTITNILSQGDYFSFIDNEQPDYCTFNCPKL